MAELTGVSTATLRAWERRYGVPAPARTETAYRLYGDADVALVAKMRDLVESGVAPAEAARSIRDHASGDRDSAAEVDPYHQACDRIVDAAMRFDVDGIRDEVNRSMSLGPAIAIFDRTFGPALARIGDLWLAGHLTVAQEHLLSNVILGRVSQLLDLLQPVDAPRRVALACFEDEEHVIALYGAGMHFAAWGYRAVFLGPRTPPDAIARVVSTMSVEVVALSLTLPPPAAKARALVDAYRDACRDAVMLVGGQGARSVRKLVEVRGGIVADMSFPELRKVVDKAVRAEQAPALRAPVVRNGREVPEPGARSPGR